MSLISLLGLKIGTSILVDSISPKRRILTLMERKSTQERFGALTFFKKSESYTN